MPYTWYRILNFQKNLCLTIVGKFSATCQTCMHKQIVSRHYLLCWTVCFKFCGWLLPYYFILSINLQKNAKAKIHALVTSICLLFLNKFCSLNDKTTQTIIHHLIALVFFLFKILERCQVVGYRLFENFYILLLHMDTSSLCKWSNANN